MAASKGYRKIVRLILDSVGALKINLICYFRRIRVRVIDLCNCGRLYKDCSFHIGCRIGLESYQKFTLLSEQHNNCTNLLTVAIGR